jgi:hypothetical protein
MPGKKGRTGVHGRQGRKRTSIRPLVAPPKELQFDQPVIASADVYALGWCLHCGAAWWEGFTITYRNGKPNEEEDEQGNYFTVVGEEYRPGQPEVHYKRCPLHKKEIRT